jgi:hypothetical protein
MIGHFRSPFPVLFKPALMLPCNVKKSRPRRLPHQAAGLKRRSVNAGGRGKETCFTTTAYVYLIYYYYLSSQIPLARRKELL